jgi:peptide deformylase
MTVLDIITPINPILRQPAKKVRALTPEIQELFDDMIETMRAAPGVGLAAPQVAVSQRIIVVEYAEPDEDPEAPPPAPDLYALINPEIVRRSKELVSGVEACLSIPGFAGEVERNKAVTVRAVNRQGDAVKIRSEGWLARIFQHEIDHLNGVLFIDRAEEVWRVEPAEEEALSEGI